MLNAVELFQVLPDSSKMSEMSLQDSLVLLKVTCLIFAACYCVLICLLWLDVIVLLPGQQTRPLFLQMLVEGWIERLQQLRGGPVPAGKADPAVLLRLSAMRRQSSLQATNIRGGGWRDDGRGWASLRGAKA